MAVEYKGKKIAMSVKVDAPLTEEKTVDLAMEDGNQEVVPSTGKTLSKVIVNKPDTMLPENIKKDIEIGGVVGVLESTKEEQEKTVNITANGTQEVTPDSGKVLSKVTVTTNIPSDKKEEQEKTINITENGSFEVTPDSGKVLSKVTGNVNVPSAKEEQEKSTTISENKTVEITPDNGKVLSKVTVTVDVASSGELPTLNAPSISLNDVTLTIVNPTTNGNFVSSYKVYDGSSLVTTVTSTTVNLSTLITAAGTHTITVKTSGTNFNDSTASNTVTYRVLSTPTISLVSGTTIQIDTIDDNATTIEVFADGLSIGEVQKQ